MIEKRLIPECFGDTMLIELLGFPKQNHQKGITKVISTLSSKYRDERGIGIIDDDKKKGLAGFSQTNETEELILLKKHDQPHYLILLKPALEKWILKNAELSGILRKDFGLPDDFDSFRKIIKDINIGQNKNFRRFLLAIKEKNPEPMATLCGWIHEILD